MDGVAIAETTQTTTRPRWWIELLLVGGGYGIYHLAQIHAPQRAAIRHGWNIVAWQRSLGIDFDRSINRFVAARSWLAIPSDYYYATLHFVVTIGVLVWLWRAHPDRYRRARRVIVAGTLIALAIFWLYPAAPPRLLSGSGFIDTNLAFHTIFAAERGSSSRAADLYATMPSLHLGWALWSAWAVAAPLRRPMIRRAVYLYPLATALVVMGTGNHFFVDLIGGAAVMALGWVIGVWLPDRWAHRGLRLRRLPPARVWATLVATAAGPFAVVVVLLGGGGLAASGLQAIRDADPIWLILALTAEAGSMAAFAALHRRTLRTAGVSVGRRTATAITFASNAISSSIPLVGSVAGTTNTWRQYHRRGAPAAAVTWALAASGVASTVALAIFMGLGATASGNPAVVGAGAAGTLVVLIFAAVLGISTRLPALRARVENSLAGLMARLPVRSHRQSQGDHASTVRNFIDQLGSYRPTLADMSFAVSAGVVNWALDAVTLALAIRAAGGHVPVADLVVIWAAAGTASSVSLTPSGIGVVEPVLAASLVLAGMNHSTAIAATLLYRSISLLLVVLVGWLVQWSLVRAAPVTPPGEAVVQPAFGRGPKFAPVARCRSHTPVASMPSVKAPIRVNSPPDRLEEPMSVCP